MSVTHHCTTTLAAHAPHEWTQKVHDTNDYVGGTNHYWCPGVKTGPVLDAAVDRYAEAERALADARATLAQVSTAHRRTYDEAIMAQDAPLDGCTDAPHGQTIAGMDGWQMWCPHCERTWDVTP